MATKAEPVDDKSQARRVAIAFAMAAFETVQLVYEWSSVLRRALQVVDRWCEAMDARDDRAMVRAAVRWMKAAEQRVPASIRQ